MRRATLIAQLSFLRTHVTDKVLISLWLLRKLASCPHYTGVALFLARALAPSHHVGRPYGWTMPTCPWPVRHPLQTWLLQVMAGAAVTLTCLACIGLLVGRHGAVAESLLALVVFFAICWLVGATFGYFNNYEKQSRYLCDERARSASLLELRLLAVL